MSPLKIQPCDYLIKNTLQFHKKEKKKQKESYD